MGAVLPIYESAVVIDKNGQRLVLALTGDHDALSLMLLPIYFRFRSLAR
jgi:hypothetical protein